MSNNDWNNHSGNAFGHSDSSDGSQPTSGYGPRSMGSPTNPYASGQYPEKHDNQYGLPHTGQTAHNDGNNGRYGSTQSGYGTPPTYGQYGERGQLPAASPYPAQRRSVIPMRPLGVGETLDAVIRILRFNPVALIVFPAAISLAFTAIQILISLLFAEQGVKIDPDAGVAGVELSGGAAASIILIMIVAFIFQLGMTNSTTRSAMASVQGHKVSFGEAWRNMWRESGQVYPRLVGFYAAAVILTVIAIFAIGLFLSAFITPLQDSNSSFLVLVLFVLIVAIWLVATLIILRLVPGPPSIIVEKQGPISAYTRAWNLTKGSNGYLILLAFAIAVILFVFSLFISFVLALLLSGAIESNNGVLQGGALIVTYLTTFVIGIFVGPFFTGLVNIVYVNMRMKREGMDQHGLGTGSR